MKLRSCRVTAWGRRGTLDALDTSLHESAMTVGFDEFGQREIKRMEHELDIAGMVQIPGFKLRVVREFAEAMGYIPVEERFEGSSGDGS